MIDHLIRFENEYKFDAFQITLPDDNELKIRAIDALVGALSVTVIGVTIVNKEAVFNADTGDLITPPVTAEGNGIIVRAKEENC